LPTEAEWEYACRAGTTTCRFFGETTLYMDSYAWSYDNAQERARPVASLMPNRFGLFDMLGNVSEWCHDVYDKDGDEWSASLRGGSAWSSPVKLRAAARYHFSYRHTDHRVGFRIARTLPGR
jgi:formylglycine-generating enzyme required for sulfatase activity